MFKLLIVLAAVLGIAMPIGAEHCTTYTSAQPEVDAAGYYVDNDPCFGCIFSIWIYQESNGIPGLQRGDEVYDDTCHGMVSPDTIVM